MGIRIGPSRGRRSGMPTSIPGKIFASLFFLIFFAAGTGFLLMMISELTGQLAQYSWTETPAVIEVSELEEDREKENPYLFTVRYRYEVEGESYVSDRYQRNDSRTREHGEVASLVDRYPPGEAVTCYVNPSDPAEAVLEQPAVGDWGPLAAFLLLPLVFVGIGLGGVYFTWRAGPTKGTAENDAAVSIGTANNARNGKRALAGFFLIFTLFGGIFPVMFFIIPAINVWQAQNWQAIDCTILSSSVGVHRGSDSTTYSIDIEYEYEVDGRTYRSTQYDFMGNVTSSGQSGKQAVVDDHPVGSTAQAYCDPDDPGNAVLNRDFTTGIWLGALTLVFPIVGIGGLIGMFVSQRRQAAAGGLGSVAGGGVSSSFAGASSSYASGGAATTTGPVTLKATEPRWVTFIFLLLFAVAWNGFVHGLMVPDMGYGFFSGIFILIGAAVALGTIYQAMRLFNPTVVMQVSSANPRLGDPLEIQWQLKGNTQRVKHLTVTLEGQEHAEYRRGTNTHTDTHTFIEQVLADRTDPISILRDSAIGEVPAGAMHSFEADHNKVVWVLRVHGVIPFWPDLNQSFAITVLPRELTHA
ncbi:MAG: DUF3592 domain-containing protein [Phycisphaeraceae bacterium]